MSAVHVVSHMTVSIDGRITGFPVDMGLHYEVAARFAADAVLTSSATLLDGAAREGIDLSLDDVPSTGDPVATEVAADAGDAPWLVIVDSRGRVRRLGWLRAQPYWSDVIVAASAATPAHRLAALRRAAVAHVVVGDERVDLPALLDALAERYDVHRVRVDAGGTLTGALLAAGLIDELHVIIAPYVVGTLPVGPTLADGLTDAARRHVLVRVDALRDGHVLLRYRPSDDAAR